MPEQKTRPVWSRTTTRTASSASAVVQRVPQLRPHGAGQGVAVGGGVEGQRRDAGGDGDLQHGSGHDRRSQPHPAGNGRDAAHWEQMSTVLPLLETPTAPSSASAREGLATTPFGLYVHVPFCATRCGYCDFNTYTSDELGPGANRAEYAGTAIAELDRAARPSAPELPTGLDRLRRRRHPHPAARRRSGRRPRRDPTGSSRSPTTSRSPRRPTRRP